MEFAEFAAQPEDALDLAVGALLIARDFYPHLDTTAQHRALDELAAPIDSVAGEPAAVQADAVGAHLYGRCGFRGNEEDYYDPRNSFLNEVLQRRLGIPITLAVVYAAVARRAGVCAQGVSFPGHFLVRIDAPGGSEPVIFDPFHGRRMTHESVEALVEKMLGSTFGFDDALLEPTPTRLVLMRMLRNLQAIYLKRRDWQSLLLVLSRMLELRPDSLAERRDRGVIAARLGAVEAARSDLEQYLESAPGAQDADVVRRMVIELRGRPTQPN
jgi:regulator of sirC expression with transglutaminase-like and TPR domain